MGFDQIIMMLIWLSGITGFVVLTPKHLKRRLLLATFNFQALVWLCSLILVSNGFISYPIRDFPNAIDVLLATEYVLYPLLYGFHIIYKPKNLVTRRIYLLTSVSIITAIDVILVYFTDLVLYVHYTWYWKWITIFVLFHLTNITFNWFMKEEVAFENEKRVSP
ncbi:hypothetical protein GCM10011351_07380 [Paraliobacillus quinghaiensis]|uniref:Uncharacterized protein n=1 Tax=Paraliobacillus quinghaiensis TaxID=470815 RepID=A0A917WQZ0_9BACI|nr:CBO0543 family protein [Paraliobacillus quinghaiensis]GGM24163.1 hypothetical protein GCM10011351_07380 [Paraliobacillus quinghaiensis]